MTRTTPPSKSWITTLINILNQLIFLFYPIITVALAEDDKEDNNGGGGEVNKAELDRQTENCYCLMGG